MSSSRSAIRADIRRRVLVEAGHRCAIPTCRHIDVDVHHIVFVEQGGKDAYENLIALCPNCHRMTHQGKIDRKALRIYKSNLRFLHDKYSQAEMDILFELSAAEAGAAMPWMLYLTILIKRSIESGFLEIVQRQGMSISTGGVDTTPIFVQITQAGRQFVADLGDHEL
ncbi:HNH endonuclease [Cohaesibacter sp. ES.047]|uniref:HNH endonuclease n=1 Tax=Cohaesibacter sp. ES.047 TaxID=1798205 RepID=UPI0018D4F89E|nr:HNH endonuclease signature motif containing protein [Cohaesibacter sp. ES.047]